MIERANDGVAAGRQRSSDEERFVGQPQVFVYDRKKKPEPEGSGLS
jgi:hypothetical protein